MGVAGVGGDLVRSAEWRRVRAFAETIRAAPAALADQIPGPQREALGIALLLRPAGGEPPAARALGLAVLAAPAAADGGGDGEGGLTELGSGTVEHDAGSLARRCRADVRVSGAGGLDE